MLPGCIVILTCKQSRTVTLARMHAGKVIPAISPIERKTN